MALSGAFQLQCTRFWEMCNNNSMAADRFFDHLTKAAMKIVEGQPLGDVFGIPLQQQERVAPHAQLEATFRLIWHERRVDEADRRLRAWLTTAKQEEISGDAFLRLRLLYAESQLVRILVARGRRTGIKECIERYGEVLRAVKRLESDSNSREGGGEALVCEAEALALTGALHMQLGELLRAAGFLRAAHHRYQLLEQQQQCQRMPSCAASGEDKCLFPSTRMHHSPAATVATSQEEARSAMATELQAAIQDKADFIRSHQVAALSGGDAHLSAELMQATEDLITLKVYLKQLTGTWISSDRQQQQASSSSSRRRRRTGGANNSSSACPDHHHDQYYEEGADLPSGAADDIMPVPPPPAASYPSPPCIPRAFDYGDGGGLADPPSPPEAADSGVWAPSPRIQFGLIMFKVAPLALPRTLQWMWRFIATTTFSPQGGAGGEQEEEQEWRRSLEEVSAASSLRSPLAHLVQSRLPPPQSSSQASSPFSSSSMDDLHTHIVATVNDAGAELSRLFYMPWTPVDNMGSNSDD